MSATRLKKNGKHNSEHALSLKLALRREALAFVGADKAHVLDLFAGPVGETWRVWQEAADYVGVDIVYRPFDVRPRIVAPWEAALQHLDLGRFSVFDLDAFGSPWGALSILSQRLRVSPGQRVAVVTTDGSWRAVRNGRVITIDADLRRLGCPQAPRTYEGRGELSRGALAAFAERVGAAVNALRVMSTRAQGGSAGASSLVYSLLCATGRETT